MQKLTLIVFSQFNQIQYVPKNSLEMTFEMKKALVKTTTLHEKIKQRLTEIKEEKTHFSR
jgi:ubiquinone biosynthesis protein Coq4